MFIKDSYYDKKTIEKVNTLVGKPYGLIEIFKIGRIGSPKLKIIATCNKIGSVINIDNSLKSCNIELRPNGIIVHFKARLDTYLLCIPYYKLSIFNTTKTVTTIYCDTYKISIDNSNFTAFKNKIYHYKAKLSENFIF